MVPGNGSGRVSAGRWQKVRLESGSPRRGGAVGTSRAVGRWVFLVAARAVERLGLAVVDGLA